MTDRRIRVALVDDDPSVRQALKRLLRCVGCDVSSYESVGMFLRDFTTDSIDCVIVDVRMPGETGLALAEFVRTAKVSIPVILMTGDVDGTLAERAVRCGAVALLSKPLNDSALIDAIEAAVPGTKSALAGRADPC
jgi:two-component system response regulator FixJ